MDQLITNYQEAKKNVDALCFSPICGKPGKGYKAHRKLAATRHSASLALIATQRELTRYAFDTKLSKDRRLARLAKIRVMVPDFEPCEG